MVRGVTGQRARTLAVAAGCLAWTGCLVAVSVLAHHQAQRAIQSVGTGLTLLTSTDAQMGPVAGLDTTGETNRGATPRACRSVRDVTPSP